ncbi:hypothetical protein AB0G15_22900 [Streptosporangium sp. NPDC023825]|uniref:hypothetical protein n=1 Tax=Streptosporangium sp. NPDC023825 TaxID=3154909 RepID=UPI003445194C
MFIQQRHRGQRLVHRRRRRARGEQVPAPGGDRGLGADQVDERVRVLGRSFE